MLSAVLLSLELFIVFLAASTFSQFLNFLFFCFYIKMDHTGYGDQSDKLIGDISINFYRDFMMLSAVIGIDLIWSGHPIIGLLLGILGVALSTKITKYVIIFVVWIQYRFLENRDYPLRYRYPKNAETLFILQEIGMFFMAYSFYATIRFHIVIVLAIIIFVAGLSGWKIITEKLFMR